MTINLKNFLSDKSKLSKMGEFQDLKPLDGLEVSSISADLYDNGRDDLAHVEAVDLDPFSISKPEMTNQGLSRSQGEKREIQMTLEAAVAPIVDSESAIRRAAKERGFTGDICDDCGGSQMVRNGTCLKCNECGSTTGCS